LVGAQFTARDAAETAVETFRPRLRRNPTSQERNTIMELLMASAAEAADTLRAGPAAVTD
jgi:hypothetical protein